MIVQYRLLSRFSVMAGFGLGLIKGYGWGWV